MSTVAASPLTRALAERSASLAYEELPPDIVELARQGLLDWFAVTLAGSGEPAPQLLLDALAEGAPPADGAATVIGHETRLGALDAALVNGTSSHALDFDDVNLEHVVHASAAVLAAAVALAEQLDAGAGALITAYVAGYETTCAVAAALGAEHYRRGFHTTGTAGAVGAAAACARLLGLGAERAAHALGIAASEAAGLKCSFGTMTKPLHAGRACQAGLLAALLAARGFTANPDAIEAPQGLAEAAGAGAAAAAEPGAADERPAADASVPGSAEHWHLRLNLFKHHAACFFTHSAIEGLEELRREHAIDVSEIERITLHIGELERGSCAIAEPATGLEVKFSLAHLAAMTVLGRPTERISDRDAHDSEVIALRSRVALADDGAPAEPTRVEVALREGRVLSAARDVSRPDPDLGRQAARLAAKFLALAEPELGPDAAGSLLAELRALAHAQPVRGLTALARRRPSQP